VAGTCRLRKSLNPMTISDSHIRERSMEDRDNGQWGSTWRYTAA